MESGREVIQLQLDRLRAATSSDFAGLAWLEQQDNRIRWLFVSGNLGERYKKLALKPGRGLAGHVIRLGRPVIVDAAMPDEERQRLRHEYSIMPVEQLQSLLAVPVAVGDETRGALLIGNREAGSFAEVDLTVTIQTADRLASHMQRIVFDEVKK